MENSKKLDKEFKKIAKNRFIDPQSCTQLRQTREYMSELHEIIKHFEQKFQYIPSSAQELFNEYHTRQERMLFEQYKKDYSVE
ncbi:MAG: hypothetical protein HC819_12785 [Cyclobacteriaceae bacterium]|nr:hypothetical protein [Cyclobacteriaceae bacterium]